MKPGRSSSQGATLARLGFAEPARAAQLLADPALAGLVDPLDDVFGDGLADALAEVADPDLALLGLVRLMEALRDTGSRRRGAGSGARRAAGPDDGSPAGGLVGAPIGARAMASDEPARPPPTMITS